MMGLRFKDVIDKMKYHIGRKEEGYSIPMAEHYNKVVGNIVPGMYTAVAGIQGAGTTSFVDQNYVMNVLLQWYFTDPDERQPLHIKYFTPKVNELKKLQQFICLYAKLVHGKIVDIPTLNSQPGRLYNIGQKPQVLEALDNAEKFFDEILDNNILEIHSVPVQPSAIYATMTDYMETIGELSDGNYILEDEYEGSLSMLVVDSVDDLLRESDGYSSPNANDTFEKLDTFCARLKTVYGVNCVLTVPAVVGYVRTPKDTEPCARHMGVFLKNCDRGVVIYNPVAEENKRLYDDATKFIAGKSKAILMRYWYVVRNSDGVDTANNQLLFLPGVGYHLEWDKEEEIYDNKVTESLLMDASNSTYWIDPTSVSEDEE